MLFLSAVIAALQFGGWNARAPKRRCCARRLQHSRFARILPVVFSPVPNITLGQAFMLKLVELLHSLDLAKNSGDRAEEANGSVSSP
jgi:hypothetical protein